MYFPREEYEERWSKLHGEMDKLGYSSAVVWQRSGGGYDRAGNVHYLTNYATLSSGQEPSHPGWPVGRSFAAVLLRRGEEPELHTSEPESTVDRGDVAAGAIYSHEENLALGLGARLNELGIEGRVACVGDDFLPAQMYRMLLEASPGIEWVPEEELLYSVQHVKSPHELDVYRQAGEVSSRALTAFMEALIRGQRQCDAAAEAASIIIRAGGGFQRVACHTGPKAEHAMWDNPLYGYSTDAPQPGDMVRAWVYGPILHGYWIDPGRTSVCGGKPRADQKKLIEDCAGLVDSLVRAFRVGTTARELGVVGDALTEELGYSSDLGGAIWHVYGHGLSTFWLGPVIPAHGSYALARHLDEPYHEGQVCTVEVFLHTPGVGTATFEQIFILGSDGVEMLSTTPMLFW